MKRFRIEAASQFITSGESWIEDIEDENGEWIRFESLVQVGWISKTDPAHFSSMSLQSKIDFVDWNPVYIQKDSK